jgi:glycerophosphoryl diester phosphodiesterase
MGKGMKDQKYLFFNHKRMIIISHRGNTAGPYSCIENSPQSILNTMKMGFDIEIDLWSDEQENLALGHDKAEYVITIEFLRKYSGSLWIHCKNILALAVCLRNSLRCFSHDNDDAVLTAYPPFIWRYPNALLCVTPQTIIVLPEKCKTGKEQLLQCAGICTDYPLRYSLEYASNGPFII